MSRVQGYKKMGLILVLSLLSLSASIVQASSAPSVVDTASKIGGLCAIVYMGYQGISYMAQVFAGKKTTKGRDYSDYGYVDETPVFFSRLIFNKDKSLECVVSEHELKTMDEQLKEDERSLEKIRQSIERRKKLINKNEKMAQILKSSGSSASFSTSSSSSLSSSTTDVVVSASFDATKSVASK